MKIVSLTCLMTMAALLLLGNLSYAEAREPMGMVLCKDAPIRLEIVDTLPRIVSQNTLYRITHYIRNTSEKPIFLYFLSRQVEIKWDKTGDGRGEMIAPENPEPGKQSFVYLQPHESFVASVEGSFGNRGKDGMVSDESDFNITFTGVTSHQTPRSIKIRIVYGFTLVPDGSFENQHSVATGWKTVQIEGPAKDRPRL